MRASLRRPLISLCLALTLGLGACSALRPAPLDAVPALATVPPATSATAPALAQPSPTLALPTTARADIWPTRGWPTSAPEEQGISSEKLARLFTVIDSQRYAIDSVLVVRNGYLVSETYYPPNTPQTLHILHSVTKSVTSALLGVALGDPALAAIDRPLVDFFPNRQAANLDDYKRAITLAHVLTMSAGLKWDEASAPYSSAENSYGQLFRAPSGVQYMLDLPVADPPGTRFAYNSGLSYLLSAIVTQITGRSALDLGRERLFGPLGITDVQWVTDRQGITIGGSELWLTPRDMAKIGYLYLRDGVWDGQRILPPGWVAASTRKHIDTPNAGGYGYQWWLFPEVGAYAAQGLAGQYIFVKPDADLVVVFTSSLPASDGRIPETLFKSYVLPALQSPSSPPDDPTAALLLGAGRPVAVTPALLPPLAAGIDGRTYDLVPPTPQWLPHGTARPVARRQNTEPGRRLWRRHGPHGLPRHLRRRPH